MNNFSEFYKQKQFKIILEKTILTLENCEDKEVAIYKALKDSNIKTSINEHNNSEEVIDQIVRSMAFKNLSIEEATLELEGIYDRLKGMVGKGPINNLNNILDQENIAVIFDENNPTNVYFVSKIYDNLYLFGKTFEELKSKDRSDARPAESIMNIVPNPKAATVSKYKRLLDELETDKTIGHYVQSTGKLGGELRKRRNDNPMKISDMRSRAKELDQQSRQTARRRAF